MAVPPMAFRSLTKSWPAFTLSAVASTTAGLNWVTSVLKRMMLKRSATRVCIGRYSHTSRPGTTVATGRNAPRYSDGAFGLRSYVSMCGGPPGSQMKMTAVSDAGRSLSAAVT